MPDADSQSTGTSRAGQTIARWRQAAGHHDAAQAIACLLIPLASPYRSHGSRLRRRAHP